MLGRINVSSAPKLLFKAPQAVRIYLWTARYVGRGQVSAQAYVSNSQETCSPAQGTPLPDPEGGVLYVPISLRVGEELWIVSEGVSLLGMDIEVIR